MSSLVFAALLGLSAGLALGGLYFWGLWFTVQRMTLSRRPGLLAACSFVLRAGLFLAAMFLVTRGKPVETVTCVVGFVAARLLVSRVLGPGSALQTRKETP